MKLKRAFIVHGTEQEHVISRVTSVRIRRHFLHFDEYQEGGWRLAYNPTMIPDFTVVKGIKIENHTKPAKKLEGVTVSILGTDLVLPLSKIVAVKNYQTFIHFDKLKDDTWMLLYSNDVLPNPVGWEGMTIVRED